MIELVLDAMTKNLQKNSINAVIAANNTSGVQVTILDAARNISSQA
jgi:hypothetical protein